MRKEVFVSRSKEVHGNKYDYSKVNQKFKSTDKVIIICPIHGNFEQLPHNHYKSGCPQCKFDKIRNACFKNKDWFISRSKEVHGNKYDYSKVEYNGVKQDLIIICPIHGKFKQKAEYHLSGRGCPKCKGSSISNKLSLGKDEFIRRAKTIHGNKYDYSKVEYKNSRTYVTIICPIHGNFEQTPCAHLKSIVGCFKCHDENIRLNTEKFIRRAKIVHGNKYDYSEVECMNSVDKIKINCKKHGYFYQSPARHLKGSGCPSCNFSKGENRIMIYLDKNNIKYIPQKRFYSLNPFYSFDFFIPDYNLLIEYDGIQHFEPCRFSDLTEEDLENNFQDIKHRDNIKNE